MRVVVLCRTDMNNDRFCTIVLGEDGELYRLLTQGNHQPRYGAFLTNGRENERWVPGRVASIRFRNRNTGVRNTHPEDSIIWPRRTELARAIVRPANLKRRIETIARDRLYDLFPGITVDWQKAFYIGDPELERSVGYLRVHRVTIVHEGAPGYEKIKAYAHLRDGRWIYLPIKDPEILERIENGELAVGEEIPGSIIFVGLANALDYRGTGEMRCYLQLLHVLP